MTDFTTRIEETIARENAPALRHLFRLFGYVFGAARGMCLTFLALSTLLSLLRPVLAIIWGRFIDTASAFGSVTALAVLLLSYYLIDFLAGLLERYTQSYEEIERLDVVQRNRFQERLDRKMYQKLARLPSEYFEAPKINDRVERVFQFTEDAWSGLNREVMVRGYMIASKAVSVVSIAATMYLLEPTLAYIALIAPIPTLYTTFAAGKIRARFVKDNTKTKREAAYFEKLMRGPAAKEIKALRLHDFIYEKWRGRIADYSAKERKAQGASALLELVSDLLTGSASGGATVLAIVRMTQGRLSIGGLGAAISLIRSLMDDTDRLFGAIGGFLAKKNEAAQFFDLMDLPEEAAPDRHVAEIGEIEARGIDYRYPMTEKWALKDVNLIIRKGEHVAFVGENRAGKTTLVRILTGMLSPSAGALVVNGTPADGAEQRQAMATVLQSPAKYYTFTVAENVKLGDVARAGSVPKALEAAGFDGADPDALLGKDVGGIELSGGEWQKLSIARAHYRNRDFILLDEPTGNLDAKAEADVFERYLTLSGGRTLVMVTHRISVASLASRIVVFSGGRIVEDGTHDQLIRTNGEYARLYREQAKWYDR